MKREVLMEEGVSGHSVRNTGMLIGKLVSFAGFFRRFRILIFREEVFPAVFLQGLRLSPETVDEVKVRAKRREGIRSRAYEGGKQGISLEFP